ncbi:MAG: response regulator [Ruminococcus sp.]|jgi:two-component system response regulator YesN|nr:response regulator [Ruminococcus sp.]
MYKIFVVEDEQLLRQNIKNIITSIKGPYVVTGEAADGEMALSMIQDAPPDILITDLKMPFLDGFGLIKHIKTILPSLKIIIISGYDEFESAQKAISLGVDMYLLKPVKREELEKAISKAVRSIEENRFDKTAPVGFSEDEQQYALRQHFISQLLYGNEDTEYVLERARTLGLDIVHPFYQVAVFIFDQNDDSRNEFRNQISRILGDEKIQLFYLGGNERLTVIHCGDNETELSDKTYQFINIVQNAVAPYGTAAAVTCNIASRLSGIRDSFAAAEKTIKAAHAIGGSEIIDVGDNVNNADDTVMSERKMQSKYSQIINQAKEYVTENFCDPDISLISTAKYVGMSPAHFSTIFAQSTGTSFINYLTSMRVNRAKELLENSDMKLSAIAMEIGYNEPNYFSHVFKKVLGITPKEYRNKYL